MQKYPTNHVLIYCVWDAYTPVSTKARIFTELEKARRFAEKVATSLGSNVFRNKPTWDRGSFAIEGYQVTWVILESPIDSEQTKLNFKPPVK